MDVTRTLRVLRLIVVRLLMALSLCLLLVLGLGPRTGRFQVMTVLTGSMAPVAPRGSLAIVTPTALRDLHVGDVLTYAIPVEDHHVITHRVIEIRRSGSGAAIRTKGDANEAADPWVAQVDAPTVWTERFAVPHLGQAIIALRSPLVHRLGQLSPLLVALIFLRNLWRKDDVTPVTPDALAA